MVHGLDVARGVVAVSQNWKAARAQRWMLTDGFVYDWYDWVAICEEWLVWANG